jgi:hypothetical protein
MLWGWILVTTLIGGAVAIGGYAKFIAKTQKKDVAGVGSTAALLDKLAHRKIVLPPTRPSPGYRSTASTACRRLLDEVSSIPAVTPERVRLRRISLSMDSFVSTLVAVPAPLEHRLAAQSFLSAAKLYRFHVQLALQGVLKGDTRGEQENLSAAKLDLQQFGAARAELGVSC